MRQQRGGHRRRNFRPRGGNRRDSDNFRGQRGDSDSPRFRKGSRDFSKRQGRADGERGRRRGGRDQNGGRIRRDRNGGRIQKRGGKRRNSQKKQDRDLDRELRNYWIKHGKNDGQDDKNLGNQKLNQEMDEYWKAREQKQQKKE